MQFLSTVKQGVYIDEDDGFDGVHPDFLNRYYGTNVPTIHRHNSFSGPGHPADEGDILEEVGAQVKSDQQSNIRHAAVDVPDTSNPWQSAHVVNIFRQALTEAQDNNIIPDHLMVMPDDWPNGYPTHEFITSGTRSGKRLLIALPYDIWWPRAVLWAQSLRIMQQLIIELET